MSSFLDQAKAAATSAVNTAGNLASQAATTTSNLASQAANSQAAATVTEQAKSFGTQAYNVAGGVAGQAHQQAHALAPTLIPAPAGGVDQSSDLEPQSPQDRAKLEKLFESRASASELKNKNILKGEPGDALAGKRAELQKSMLENKLDKDIATRPAPEELVQKGILNPDEAPPSK